MTLWFTSDLHIGHARINELAGRPFSSVEEMDYVLLNNWNSVVSPLDSVFVLGDLALGTFTESMQLAARLQGEKFLVPGNHDRVSSLYRGSDAKKSEWQAAYRDAGFTVVPEQLAMTLRDGTRVLMCHFPYEGDSHGEDRYVEARPKDKGNWLLHGHVHEQWKVRGRMINVGVDVWDFTPVSEEEILKVIDSG